jgi:hypothetical protein
MEQEAKRFPEAQRLMNHRGVVSVTKKPGQNGVWTGFKGKVIRDVAYCRAMAMRTASSGETR